jgi:hypothetical protein
LQGLEVWPVRREVRPSFETGYALAVACGLRFAKDAEGRLAGARCFV